MGNVNYLKPADLSMSKWDSFETCVDARNGGARLRHNSIPAFLIVARTAGKILEIFE